MTSNPPCFFADTPTLRARSPDILVELSGKNIQLYYVNLLYFDKNIVLGRMLAVSYLNLAHTHYAY